MTVSPESLDNLNEFIDVLNEALGSPNCGVHCEHGGTCSLDTGHEGDHIAKGFGDRILCEWPQ